MQPVWIKIILAMAIGLITAAGAWAFEGRTAYETGDGHWIYFGPAASAEWTAERRMPLKRSLEQSIRGDALRHYALPSHVLPESGKPIVFYGAAKVPAAKTDAKAAKSRSTPESAWQVFELPESGKIIRFHKPDPAPPADVPTIARRGVDRR